jgi:hypothetical protein
MNAREQAEEKRLTKAAADLSQRLAKVTAYDAMLPIMKEARALGDHGHDIYMAALGKWEADVHRKLDMLEAQNERWYGKRSPGPPSSEREKPAMSPAELEHALWSAGAGGSNPLANRTLHQSS